MHRHTRRQFLAEMGSGMVAAGIGLGVAADMGFAPLIADDSAPKNNVLDFGALEPLVALLQETSPDKVLPIVVEKVKKGLDLKQLTAAAALANARTFGGEHYGGFHSFMAMLPAYQMSQELPSERAALPILKVIYRNSTFIQSSGGRKNEVLKPLDGEAIADNDPLKIREAVNSGNKSDAERRLNYILSGNRPQDGLQAALLAVEDNHDVHTVVLPWRAYALLELTGKEHAFTLLRQSVRKCAQQSVPKNAERKAEVERQRALVPKLMEEFKLLAVREQAIRGGDDAWIEKLAAEIFNGKPEDAARAVASAIAENFDPQHIAEAISLASNALILRQVENSPTDRYGKRTHGDSMGVHASDTTNAWRNMLRVCDARHCTAGLMLAAANVAQSSRWGTGEKLLIDDPFPHAEQLEKITAKDEVELLKALDGAIRENNQLGACAAAARYQQLGFAPRPIMDVLLKYAISEDGRLHSEKYYRTVSEEFATTRASLRWRQILALARVTASSYGLSAQDQPTGRAPGYEESCKLLGVG